MGVMAAAVPVGTAAYGLRFEPYRLVVDRVEVHSPRVPRALDGLKIGQLTDTHYGSSSDQAFIERASNMLQRLAPDLIVLTGDYVHHAGEPEPAARALGSLRAPLGVFAVLGNHDHWHGALAVESAFRSAFLGQRFDLLRNAHHTVDVAGTPLHIVGADDAWEGPMDLPKALIGLPRDEPAILLAHEPDVADQTSAAYPFILQLSGHSHGGQVRIPLIGAPVLPYLGRKYPIGLRFVEGMFVYTSRGVGMASPPVRFRCPPEVTLITLRAAPL